MSNTLTTGLQYAKELVVTGEYTAAKLGSGGLDVLATPALVALMEGAAFGLAEEYLEDGFSTVGTKLEIEHLAATPLGMKVTAKAELIRIDGKKLVFAVEARDEKDLVGRGVHERFIIEVNKFLARVQAKRN